MCQNNSKFSGKTDEDLVTMYRNCLRAIINETIFAPEAWEKLPAIREETARRTKAAQETYYVQTPEVGLLKTLGYRVGNSGERQKYRRQLLDHAMSADLPFVGTIAYSLSWGAPLSSTRYFKLVRTLESFITNAKIRPGMALACSHWQADLDYVVDTWGERIEKQNICYKELLV
jgi:hypothetical protein